MERTVDEASEGVGHLEADSVVLVAAGGEPRVHGGVAHTELGAPRGVDFKDLLAGLAVALVVAESRLVLENKGDNVQHAWGERISRDAEDGVNLIQTPPISSEHCLNGVSRHAKVKIRVEDGGGMLTGGVVRSAGVLLRIVSRAMCASNAWWWKMSGYAWMPKRRLGPKCSMTCLTLGHASGREDRPMGKQRKLQEFGGD